MSGGRTFLRAMLAANLASAAGISLFWIGFYAEIIFPTALMASRIPHFDGYYAWETSFTLPDMVVAVVDTLAATRLWTRPGARGWQLLLAACAGALTFLGILDLTYGVRHGMYHLGHPFSLILMCVGVGLPVVGVATLIALGQDTLGRTAP